MDNSPRGNGGDTFPRPDPTKLTTEQLDRELGHVETRLSDQIKALHDHSDLVSKSIEVQHAAFVVEMNHRFDALTKRADENRLDINLLREGRAAVLATDARSVVQSEHQSWSLAQMITVISSAVAGLLAIAAIFVMLYTWKH